MQSLPICKLLINIYNLDHNHTPSSPSSAWSWPWLSPSPSSSRHYIIILFLLGHIWNNKIKSIIDLGFVVRRFGEQTLVLAITSLPSIFTFDEAADLEAEDKAFIFVTKPIGKWKSIPGIARIDGNNMNILVIIVKNPFIPSEKFAGEVCAYKRIMNRELMIRRKYILIENYLNNIAKINI
jgi:hypothetical protein